MPFAVNVQVTPVRVGSFSTRALNCMVTTVAGTVITSEAKFAGCAAEVAITATARFAGIAVGALYVTDEEAWLVSDPHAAPEQPSKPASDQVTPYPTNRSRPWPKC